MAAMTGHDIFQPDITHTGGNLEIRRHVPTGKDIRIGLPLVVDRIHQRLHMAAGQRIISQAGFIHIDRHTGDIAFRRPGVDKDANIGSSFQKWIQVGYILFPADAIFPMVDIDRLTVMRQTVVGGTEMSYPERCHETHQFDRRFIIFARNDPDHVFQLRTIHFRELLFSLSDVQQVDARLFRQDETGTGLIPAVAVGGNRHLQFDRHIAFVFGQRYFLQDDTPVHQMVNAVRPRRIIGFRIDIRCKPYGRIVKHTYGKVSFRRNLPRSACRQQ